MVLKLDLNGGFLWHRFLTSTDSESINSIVLDPSSDAIYGTGQNIDMSSTFVSNVLLFKMNVGSPNLVWIRRIGGTGADDGKKIILSGTGIFALV